MYKANIAERKCFIASFWTMWIFVALVFILLFLLLLLFKEYLIWNFWNFTKIWICTNTKLCLKTYYNSAYSLAKQKKLHMFGYPWKSQRTENKEETYFIQTILIFCHFTIRKINLKRKKFKFKNIFQRLNITIHSLILFKLKINTLLTETTYNTRYQHLHFVLIR